MKTENLPRTGCGAVILRDNRLLLVYRKRDPESGHWGLPGGKVEPFETLQQAVRREISEETGLQIEQMRLLCIVEQITPERKEHWIAPVFMADTFTGEPVIREPDALGDMRWFPSDTLPQPLTCATEKALQAMAEQGVFLSIRSAH